MIFLIVYLIVGAILIIPAARPHHPLWFIVLAWLLWPIPLILAFIDDKPEAYKAQAERLGDEARAANARVDSLLAALREIAAGPHDARDARGG